MRMFLAAVAATMLTTAAFAADPMAPPAPTSSAPSATPASTASTATCAQLISQARGMTMPSDSTKAKQVKDELAAADSATDDATCKTHANNALNLLSGM